ncbi:hypothetical protein CASFOL_004639 [Castilleja foliolosa]|uniref:Uncharacterized protein n=1 Tax=Castilleja foliolosa TaxID=1961234 RepID=A0ABD3ED30_9LAMI
MADENQVDVQPISKLVEEEAVASKLLEEEAGGSKPDEIEVDDKWMQAASKWLEEVAAASKLDVKWPPSKWMEEEPNSRTDESEVDEVDPDEGQAVKRQKTEANEDN